MNNKILFSLLVASLLTSGIAIASVASNFVLNNIPYSEWNNSEFDKLALDAVIPANNGQVDIMQSLSLMNLENASSGKGIKDLYLWEDKGSAGFQGMGVDKKIGKGEYDQMSGTWYWKDADLIVPIAGLRVFVTAETERTISSKYYVRLTIPQLNDMDNDGQFDIGDKGIFMFSGNNGPTDAQAIASESLMIKSTTADTKAPKVVITNLRNDYKINLDEAYLVSGLSRDQSFSNTQTVKINIVKEGQSNDTWTVANTDRNNYERWTYSWTPSSIGKYTIKVKAMDFNENEMISEGIVVEVVNSSDKVSLTNSLLSVDKTTAVADGKIRINGQVVVKDEDGNPLGGKLVEITYLRSGDGYIARDVMMTNNEGVLVWGIPTKTVGNVVLTAIVDGYQLNQSLAISFTE
jgi:hypothetical protein